MYGVALWEELGHWHVRGALLKTIQPFWRQADHLLGSLCHETSILCIVGGQAPHS